MQQIGVIGMAVMGKNLSLNLKHHGYSVSIFNITKEETEEVINKYGDEKLVATYTWKEFVQSLQRPRKIIMMIKAGDPVDQTINNLKKLLDPNDILIDGGNSFYKDTNKRYQQLHSLGIKYVGMGISGGELGALNGPSIMPGGDKDACNEILPILKNIAAKTIDNIPCVDYIGPKGSGHYVKMVHNGIEYGIMQMICEIYDVLRKCLNMSNQDISTIFSDWNNGVLNSYLVSITSDILKQKDSETNKDIVDVILNRADYKGTGNWMIEDALHLGAPISVILAAVFARFVSDSVLSEELDYSKFTKENNYNETDNVIEQLKNALYLSQIVSYAQGFEQLRLASSEYQWNLNYASIAEIWESGCIIRSKTLIDIRKSFEDFHELNNIFEAPFFKNLIENNLSSLKLIVSKSQQNNIPTPALSASLNYLLSIFNTNLPANLLQAQRDYFGAHTYKRIDKPGIFHTSWYTEK